MSAKNNYNGPPMLAIDGSKIRKLREERGLTQLYIATVVEVTTDTISRWENRRYPSIKKENGEKLAQALAVPLADILEKPGHKKNELAAIKQSPSPTIPAANTTARWADKRLLIAFLTAMVIMGAILAWWQMPSKDGIKQVHRYLPTHIPPGQIFPVIITITTDTADPVAMIVKESLQGGAIIIKGNPAFTSLTKDASTIRWVRREKGGEIIFSYLARSSINAQIDTAIDIIGTVTSGRGTDAATAGPGQVMIKPFHWADLNSDNRIDDEEILAVYDQLNLIDDLDFNRDLIDAIWSGSGYRWDYEAEKYIIFP